MPPQFILIPGLHGTRGLFEPFLKIFPACVIELPRQGPQDYATLSAWLSSQPFPKSYVLVGESFGGPLAILHAALQPQGLKGLVLLGSFARMDVPPARLLGHLLPPLPLGWRLLRKINQHALMNDEGSPAQNDWLQAELSKTSPWIFRARMQAVMLGDVTAALPKIKVPVLAVTAACDQMVPAQASQDFEGIPHLRRVLIDSPHLIAGMRPRELAKALRGFP